MAAARGGRRRAQPGGHPLRPEVIAHHQRQRILDGAARIVAKLGYRQVSVADIVRSAAVSRSAFYDNFSSKEDCFLVLYDGATEAALKVVAESCERSAGEFPDRVRASLSALVDFLDSNRDLARAWIVEGPPAGPQINDRFERMIGGFAELLRAGRREAPSVAELPDTLEETVIGGLYWLLYYALLEERPRQLRALLPQLTEFSLIPFVGAEAARGAVAG